MMIASVAIVPHDPSKSNDGDAEDKSSATGNAQRISRSAFPPALL